MTATTVRGRQEPSIQSHVCPRVTKQQLHQAWIRPPDTAPQCCPTPPTGPRPGTPSSTFISAYTPGCGPNHRTPALQHRPGPVILSSQSTRLQLRSTGRRWPGVLPHELWALAVGVPSHLTKEQTICLGVEAEKPSLGPHKTGLPSLPGKKHAPSRAPVAAENSPPCRQDPEASPEEGGRGRAGLLPAPQQGRVDAAELGLQGERAARGQTRQELALQLPSAPAFPGLDLRGTCAFRYPNMPSKQVSTAGPCARGPACMSDSGRQRPSHLLRVRPRSGNHTRQGKATHSLHLNRSLETSPPLTPLSPCLTLHWGPGTYDARL